MAPELQGFEEDEDDDNSTSIGKGTCISSLHRYV